MTPEQLRAAAEDVIQATTGSDPRMWLDHEKAECCAKHILATVNANDAEPVTVDDCEELGLPNSSISPYQRRYELAPGIRVVAEACPGGFNVCELWIGSGNRIKEFKSISKGQLRHLLAGLGMGGRK